MPQKKRFPTAFDRDAEGLNPPSSGVLNYVPRLEECPASDSDSSPDEGLPPLASGWIGSFRLHSQGSVRRFVPRVTRTLAARSTEIPSKPTVARSGRKSQGGLQGEKAARHTWVGERLPQPARFRCSSLFRRKKKWRLTSQTDPSEYLELKAGSEGAWRSNYASVRELVDKVEEVMEDQVSRGQLLKYSEAEAHQHYRLGRCLAGGSAQRETRKDHHSSYPLRRDARHQHKHQDPCQRPRTLSHRSRHQRRRAWRASVLLRSPRTSRRPTANWHLLGSQVRPGGTVYVNKVGSFGAASASYCWSRVGLALGRLSQYLAGDTA